ncbi:MAG TPA: S8 family serine peptidase [Blastocatellia bacterium]|nr:S8 family serine peptidase [Blastocatellia bacterium]
MNRRRALIPAFALLLVSSVLQPVSHAQEPVASGDYYYNAGGRGPIVRSTTRAAVRIGSQVDKTSLVGRLATQTGVVSVRDIRAGGLLEVTLAPSAKSEANAAATVRAMVTPQEAAVMPVFFEPGVERDASTLFLADDLLVQFGPAVARDTIEELSSRLGADIVEPLGYAPNGFRLRVTQVTEGHDALTVANALFETGLCRFAHPNFLASRSLRAIPNDPQFANQWHLLNTGQGSGSRGADVKATEAWDITLGDPSVTVAVADTGIDYHHGDFDVTIDGVAKVTSPRDVVHGDNDPFPGPGDENIAHGTAAAGVAVAAADNSYATTGVAPNCRLMPIQLYAESTFTPNATEADAFLWAADHGAAVMSNSWGPDNDDTPLPDATRVAIDYATSTGRNGKGMVIFFAAGNSNDDTVHDNYVSYPGVVAVAASTNFDTRAGYSRFGRAVAIAAPSNGGSLAITTTDLTGPNGYSSGDYTSNFGGTSSACPLAAGVAALVLSVNPDLTWEEVRDVLEDTADKIDPGGGGYDVDGHSLQYGFGRVNARAAVERALEILNSNLPRVSLASVTGPEGAGVPLQLRWSTSGPNPVTSQVLSYSTDGGATFGVIDNVAPGTTEFSWAVPDSLSGAVTVRIMVTDSMSHQASDDVQLDVWARPALLTAKLKKAGNGKLSLIVDGSAIRVGEAQLFVGDTLLGSIKFPARQQLGDGTTTRIVSKDSRLKSLIPAGATVQITVHHPTTGQVSAALSFSR